MNNFKGYGFRPSEEELIGYLRDRTFRGRDCLVQDITDLGADICMWAPWDLPGCTKVTSSDPVWHFIYPITYKRPKKNQKMIDKVTNKDPDGKQKQTKINRVTNYGNWKESGNRLMVRASDSKKEIGKKTRLYFDPSRAKNENNKKTIWVLYQYELIDVDAIENKYFLGKLMMKQSEPTNISSQKGETSHQLPSDYMENYQFPTPEVQLDFHQEPLVEIEVSNDYDWIQNQSSEQTNEFVNSFPVNYETYREERSNQENFVNDGNEVISNLKPSNLENYVADNAIPQNLLVACTEHITNPEVSNIGIGAQNQLYTNQQDHTFQSVLLDNNETYPEERSNQHNIVTEEGFNLPFNFKNPIADISQMNLFEFDDLYWDGIYYHELFGVLEAPDNNGDGVQNQSSINQQVADDFRNPNLIDNEIDYPDERSKSAAAEIEGSKLPSLGMTESSSLTETLRKRSSMEHEGSSIGTETEVAEAQAKKSRF